MTFSANMFNHFGASSRAKRLSHRKCSPSFFWHLTINISQFNLTDACCDTAERPHTDGVFVQAADLS